MFKLEWVVVVILCTVGLAYMVFFCVYSDPYAWNNSVDVDSQKIEQNNLYSNSTYYLDVFYHDIDIASPFLIGLFDYYWLNNQTRHFLSFSSITLHLIKLQDRTKKWTYPYMIVKRYLGEISKYGLQTKYSVFSWGDILLKITKNHNKTNKSFYVIIDGNDEHCEWHNNQLLIHSNAKDPLLYSEENAFNKLSFNVSRIPVIATQFYDTKYWNNGSMNLPTVYLPLFIRFNIGNFNEMMNKYHISNQLDAFNQRKYRLNAMFSLKTGIRNNYSSLLSYLSIPNTKHFVSMQSIESKQYVDVLLQSKFTVCPSGNNPEQYRIWEAMFFGSIPIIAIDSYYFNHQCKHSYYPFIKYKDVDNHTDQLLLNECRKKKICWSKNNALFLLNKSLNDFIPMIVITDWNQTNSIMKDMSQFGIKNDKYWNLYQDKMIKWTLEFMEVTTMNVLNRIFKLSTEAL